MKSGCQTRQHIRTVLRLVWIRMVRRTCSAVRPRLKFPLPNALSADPFPRTKTIAFNDRDEENRQGQRSALTTARETHASNTYSGTGTGYMPRTGTIRPVHSTAYGLERSECSSLKSARWICFEYSRWRHRILLSRNWPPINGGPYTQSFDHTGQHVPSNLYHGNSPRIDHESWLRWFSYAHRTH